LKKPIREKTAWAIFCSLLLVTCSLFTACSDYTGEDGIIRITVGGGNSASRSTTGYPPQDAPGGTPGVGPLLSQLAYRVYFNGTEMRGSQITNAQGNHAIQFTLNVGTYNIRIESYEPISGSPSLYAVGKASNVQVQAGQTKMVTISMSQAATVTFQDYYGSGSDKKVQVGRGEKVDEPPAPTSPPNTGKNQFSGWYSERAFTTAWIFTTATVTDDITLYAKWDFQYNLGDTGPGGGKIFYRSETGFTMTDDSSTAYYLEAAPADMSTNLIWPSLGFDGTDIPGTETAIGTGRKNTALILAIDPTAPAADACNVYSSNGKTDWFLPGKDELNELYVNRRHVSSMTTGKYWSSSQYNIAYAWYQDFANGDQAGYRKADIYYVRAIRAF
jgi:uncharacterized repeat protein (TIGR02543 family)